jgi:tRNA 2-thiouridine synthesizing protein A
LDAQDVMIEVDAIGLKCPLPIVMARRAIKAMRPGSRLTIKTDDPASVIDVPHFCSEAGLTILDTQRDGVVFAFVVSVPTSR